MFREMRRKRQLLTEEETLDILLKGTSGVLSLLGDDGYPYGVPLSYVYHENKIYFHGAKAGHKLDAMRNCDKASFCVIAQDQVQPETFTTHYKSVIAFGKIHVVEDSAERRASIEILGRKYSPGLEEKMEQEIEKDDKRLNMFVLEIEHMTGKQCIELV